MTAFLSELVSYVLKFAILLHALRQDFISESVVRRQRRKNHKIIHD